MGWTGEGCERRVKDEEEERKKYGEEKKGRMEEKEEDGEGKEEEREEEEECPFGCTEHGQCSPGAQCRCEPGWTGRNCQIGECFGGRKGGDMA